jgi:hypothetical protein
MTAVAGCGVAAGSGARKTGDTVKKIWGWVPILAVVTGVILVTPGPPGTARAAASTASGYGAAVITRTAQQTVTDHTISGVETSVSCLTASRCVAVGSLGLSSRGVVVTLTNGAQSHAVVLRSSSVIDSVSCRKSVCWAIGHPVHGTGAYLVKISSAGRPVAEQTVPLPARTILGPISCSSPTSCEIAGADNRIRPSAIVIGDWNGKKLHLHRVTVKGSKRLSMKAISCWRGYCEAVGGDTVGPGYNNYQGLILTTAGGKPARLNPDSGQPFADGVSCVSATTCYGTDGGALVVTVTRGVVTHGQGGAGGALNAIECTASDCEAAGTVALPQYSTQDGWLQSLTDGTWGASTDDGAAYFFTGIAARGGNGGFIAVGAGGYGSGSDVAVG